LDEGKPVVRVEQRAGPSTEGRTVVIASASIAQSGDRAIYLKIDARGGEYDFSYALEPNKWVMLKKGADGTILSTKVAGGFVGAMLGMHAFAGE
jgi:xylan 1,4-beta-xylosidase